MNTQYEKYRPLLTGLLDGELTAEEATEVNDAMIKSAELREEYNRLCHADEELKHMSTIEPGDEVVRRLWKNPFHFLAVNVGSWLFIGGYLCLIGFGITEFAKDSSEPLFPKIAISAIIGGPIIMLVALIFERVATHKTDPYKDIER